jgi:hypothetical protein
VADSYNEKGYESAPLKNYRPFRKISVFFFQKSIAIYNLMAFDSGKFFVIYPPIIGV